MFFTRTARALAYAQIQWLGFAYKPSNTELAKQVQSHLKLRRIPVIDDCILITKVGLATIAVHADYAISRQGSLIVPGVDHNGRRGFLVLNAKTAPFHSLATSASEAYAESMQA